MDAFSEAYVTGIWLLLHAFLMYLLTPNGATQSNDVRLGKVYLGSLFVKSCVGYGFYEPLVYQVKIGVQYMLGACTNLGHVDWHHGVNDVHSGKVRLGFIFLLFPFVSGCGVYSFYSQGDQVEISVKLGPRRMAPWNQ